MTTTADLHNLFLQHPFVSTDTRRISPGSMFFALKGEIFDANAFAKQALDSGAAYAIIDNPTYKLSEKYLLVDDVLTALQDLARYHRRQLNIPVIGLTGTKRQNLPPKNSSIRFCHSIIKRRPHKAT